MPNKVKLSLEKGKKIEYNDEKLASFINDCINIENNIKDINKVDESIKKCKNEGNIEIKFDCDEQINSLVKCIEVLGKIVVFDKNIIFDSLIINKDEQNKKSAIIDWIKEKNR